ncbi:MAG: hypothetical protein NTV79_08325 [Candidatus Aureabacteria bacterium]|nr:hypothetical protein [Candidatus Auribacterota bacterium]
MALALAGPAVGDRHGPDPPLPLFPGLENKEITAGLARFGSGTRPRGGTRLRGADDLEQAAVGRRGKIELQGGGFPLPAHLDRENRCLPDGDPRLVEAGGDLRDNRRGRISRNSRIGRKGRRGRRGTKGRRGRRSKNGRNSRKDNDQRHRPDDRTQGRVKEFVGLSASHLAAFRIIPVRSVP